MANDFPGESHITRLARFQVGRVQQIQNKLYVLNAELENEKILLARKLNAMKEAGVPDEPWAGHWRMVLDLPR